MNFKLAGALHSALIVMFAWNGDCCDQPQNAFFRTQWVTRSSISVEGPQALKCYDGSTHISRLALGGA
jgi:hypothetical protein